MNARPLAAVEPIRPLTRNQRVLLEGLRTNLADLARRLETMVQQLEHPESASRAILSVVTGEEAPEFIEAIRATGNLLGVLVPELRRRSDAAREVVALITASLAGGGS